MQKPFEKTILFGALELICFMGAALLRAEVHETDEALMWFIL